VAGIGTGASCKASVFRPKLSWAPPTLTEPVTIEVSDSKANLKLDQTKDYIIKMPAKPLQGGLGIWGGRNVVLIGGEIHIPTKEEVPPSKAARVPSTSRNRRGRPTSKGFW
jgi:hypothetical protein